MKTRTYFCTFFFAMMAIFIAVPQATYASNLMDMVEQLDKMDQQDLQELLNKADVCTQERNFTCSEEQLRKAAKLANGSKDKQALKRANLNLLSEKIRVKQEALARAEEERQIRLAEERRIENERAEAEREEAEREEERMRMAQLEQESSTSSAPNTGLLLIQGIGEVFEKQNKLTKIQNDTMQDLNRIQQEKQARKDAERREKERAAAERRAQENERLRQQNQARQRREQERQQESARKLEEQRQARKRAEDAATKLAEEKAEKAAQQKRKQKDSEEYISNLNTISNQPTKKIAYGKGAESPLDDQKRDVAKNKETHKKQSKKLPGESAQSCVNARTNGDTLTFTNNCSEHVFVLWCGDLKYTKKKCGDGPSGGYYTQSENIPPGKESTTTINGQYHYAACKGGISFGNDGNYKDHSDGTITCLKR